MPAVDGVHVQSALVYISGIIDLLYPPSCFRLQQTCMTMQGDMDRLRRTSEVRGQFYLYMYQSLSYSVAYIESNIYTVVWVTTA